MTFVPWPKRLKDLGTRRARVTRPIRNGQGTIAAGTLGQVVAGGTWSHLTFHADQCPCCGYRPTVRGQLQTALELVREELPEASTPTPNAG